MNDGMPNALAVSGAAARIERAWWQVTRPLRILITAAVVVSSVVAVGLPSTGGRAGWWALCGALLASAALVDVHEHRLPNGLLTLALISSLVPVCLGADLEMMARATVGGLVAGGLLALVRVVRGMGMGDVKMAGVIGVSVGCFAWTAALIAVACAAAVGAAYGLLRRRQCVAFGPALWFGWLCALFGISTGWWS